MYVECVRRPYSSYYTKMMFTFWLQEPQLTANETFDVYTKKFSL